MIKRDRCVICALYYHILNHVFIRIQSTSIEGLHQYIRSKHLIYHQIIVKRTLFCVIHKDLKLLNDLVLILQYYN